MQGTSCWNHWQKTTTNRSSVETLAHAERRKSKRTLHSQLISNRQMRSFEYLYFLTTLPNFGTKMCITFVAATRAVAAGKLIDKEDRQSRNLNFLLTNSPQTTTNERVNQISKYHRRWIFSQRPNVLCLLCGSTGSGARHNSLHSVCDPNQKLLEFSNKMTTDTPFEFEMTLPTLHQSTEIVDLRWCNITHLFQDLEKFEKNICGEKLRRKKLR